jgi:site-specific DNA-methyltransferase (adenine-specific)
MLYEKTVDGGVVVWVVGDATIDGSETGTSLRQALRFMEVGFNLHDTMIWYKTNAFNFGSNNCYRQSFHYMFIFSKGHIITPNLIKDVPTKMRGKVSNGGTKYANGRRDKGRNFVIGDNKKRDNVWLIDGVTINYNHPAIFPEQLAADHIVSWSNVNDLILDPFLGSGTTAYCAKKLNRRCIGIEIEEKYCEMAAKRCAQSVMNFGQVSDISKLNKGGQYYE